MKYIYLKNTRKAQVITGFSVATIFFLSLLRFNILPLIDPNWIFALFQFYVFRILVNSFEIFYIIALVIIIIDAILYFYSGFLGDTIRTIFQIMILFMFQSPLGSLCVNVQIGAFSAQFGMNIIFFLSFAIAYRLLMYFFDIQLNYRTLDLEGDYSNDLGITLDESSDGFVTYDLSQIPNEIQQEVVLTPKGLRLAKSKGIPEEGVTFPKITEDGEYTIFDFNVSDDDDED